LVLAVSWLADSAAHWVDPRVISALYPIVQVILVAFVVLPPIAAHRLILAIVMIAVASLAARGVARPDVFVRTICWAGIVLMLWPTPSLRVTVLSAFGLCWLAWIGYSLSPSWATWGVYQGLRAGADGVFCWASARA